MNTFVLLLPNIRSGHNVGAIFRTADGAGVDKIYLTGYSPCPPHPQVDKVSLGAEKTVPWEYYKQPGRLIKKLKADGYRIIGLEQTKNSVSIYSWQPRFPLALIVGNEKIGITPSVLKLCDEVVHLPMRGMKKSLNVSIAAGVAIYHIAEKIK
ncbi:MAG: RNA methyltransferase [Candidatus Magasanikbacteria bacterium]|nr:RNA methyltransferase [Candidatus Magasanikbacteria bacterium]